MNIPKTICIRCKKEIMIPGLDPSTDLSHLKPDSPIMVRCTECSAVFRKTFSECPFRPIELSV